MLRHAFIVLAAVAGLMLSAEARAAPQRVASLNLCADQLLLLLADRDQIASVSWLSRDPGLSVMAEAAKSVPINQGLAEEILPLQPDLVVAGVYAARSATMLLQRFGMRVLQLDLPKDFDAIEQQVRTVASALGHVERGERIVADMRRRLASIRLGANARPTAAVYHPNGFTIGAGSLVDSILRRAGFDNLAVRFGIENYSHISVEFLLVNQPDLLVVDTETDEGPSLARANLMHPALGRARLSVATIPRRLWSCGLPAAIDAVEILARRREAMAVARAGSR